MLAWWRRRALAHKARQSRTGGRTDPLIRRARRPSRKGLMIGSGADRLGCGGVSRANSIITHCCIMIYYRRVPPSSLITSLFHGGNSWGSPRRLRTRGRLSSVNPRTPATLTPACSLATWHGRCVLPNARHPHRNRPMSESTLCGALRPWTSPWNG